ncbi:GDSL-type esterase/lipase family protein [Mucilaginibacter sabulilitoris]|uniref:GDSL-type esterase/lipase family protein n=1 Tax=Mucilaginibacter sabulilitoris TaxID=1173583 RepID=A0ABZ0TPL5_9SPHI|nr:GDSL-type esterase/lipase family protein [Mucilaginibacter sabulilitoris]WPU94741.1 GDSL-type esterase/lipase family protein [Mucilaginibacter sabulilitoris]
MKFMLSILLTLLISGSSCRLSKPVQKPAAWSPVLKHADAKPGSLGDPNLKFIGRWDFSDRNRYTSYWGGAYVRVRFSGRMISMRIGHPTNFFARIDDGPWISYKNAKDTVTFRDIPSHGGWHTLTVAQGKDYDYLFDFRGFILPTHARTTKPVVSKIVVEYIGDSITSGYTDDQANVSDYGWVAAEILGAEHTQIAYPGINLIDGYGRVKGNGMESQYFKSRSLKYPDAAAWDFRNYTADIVLINLGTNDNNNKVPDSAFRHSYISLIKGVRANYPKARIIALQTFLGIKTKPTLEAVAEINHAGDLDVYFLETSGWIAPKTSDYNDTAHPSVAGQEKVGRILAEKLKAYL